MLLLLLAIHLATSSDALVTSDAITYFASYFVSRWQLGRVRGSQFLANLFLGKNCLAVFRQCAEFGSEFGIETTDTGGPEEVR